MSSASSTKSHKRLIKEFSSFADSSLCSISLASADDYSNWKVDLKGPADSPYVGGIFVLSFVFPSTYPMKPPEVNFLTPIFHPNVSMKNGGSICPDALCSDWSPTVHVTAIIERLVALLLSPAEESPLDPEAFELWKNQRKKFLETAASWTKKHAKP